MPAAAPAAVPIAQAGKPASPTPAASAAVATKPEAAVARTLVAAATPALPAPNAQAPSAPAANAPAPQTPAPAAAPQPAPQAKPAASAASAQAATPVPVPRAERKPPKSMSVGCIISPERVAEIGSPVVGIVRELKVDSGDAVRGGQQLVTLQSDVESAGVQAAQARSQIDADVRAAEANLALARQRHERAIELQSKGFVSSQAVDQARAEWEVAAQRLQQARGQQVVAQRELGVMRAQLDQRVVRSPFDGVVTDRYVNLGERVEDRPLMRVAMLNPLRVELVMPAHRYGSVALNDVLAVQPELPDQAPVGARVTHVDKVIDPASNTFRVRLRLPNPGHRLPAGARCKWLEGSQAAAAATAPEPVPAATGKASPQASAKPGAQAKAKAKAGTDSQARGPARRPPQERTLRTAKAPATSA